MLIAEPHRKRPVPLTLHSLESRDKAPPLQKLLFSATLSREPQQLELLNLFKPKLISCL